MIHKCGKLTYFLDCSIVKMEVVVEIIIGIDND